MLLGRRMAESLPPPPPPLLLLLLLLLLPAACLAQSGEGDPDLEARIGCLSHISTAECSLTCKLTGGTNEDDEDDDAVESVTVCFTKPLQNTPEKKLRCLRASGDSITSAELKPLARLDVTIQLKGGAAVRRTVQLKKIVQPRSPEVWNVTVKRESNQAVFHIRTPYQNDYLKVENQLFQLRIWNSRKTMVQNVSASDRMAIGMDRLQKDLKYQVKIRAIPLSFHRGSWSEWSDPLTFSISDVQARNEERKYVTRKLIVCLLSLLVLTSILGVFWKKKIFPYMWPSIPHPEPALVHNCKPNQVALLLNLKPEEFSALKIYPTVEAFEQERPLAIHRATSDIMLTSDPCSNQNSDCSISTEELEFSTSPSSSCSGGHDSLRSSSSPLVAAAAPSPGDSTPHVLGACQKEEDYVTMSSFYQIK